MSNTALLEPSEEEKDGRGSGQVVGVVTLVTVLVALLTYTVFQGLSAGVRLGNLIAAMAAVAALAGLRWAPNGRPPKKAVAAAIGLGVALGLAAVVASSPPPVVTDDGRAFGWGGFSQFTLRVDPLNTGVRLVRRLDSGVSRQSATITVNGRPAGMWEPVKGNIGKWLNQTAKLPPALTRGQQELTITNTFTSSTNDFNEFAYSTDQRVSGRWIPADAVDIGPGHLASEKEHNYRIRNETWHGTQTFSY